jgi:hypothetical protein
MSPGGLLSAAMGDSGGAIGDAPCPEDFVAWDGLPGDETELAVPWAVGDAVVPAQALSTQHAATAGATMIAWIRGRILM